MAAANTDYFTECGTPGTATTLAAPGHSIAGTSFTVVSTSGWPTNTGVIFAVDNYTLQTVNGVPNTAVRTAGTYTEWEGVVASATSITGATLRYGTDQNYSAGSLTRVYIPVASSRENRLVQGLVLNLLNQDGTVKNNAITSAAQITDGIIGDAEMSTEVKPVTLMNENTFDHVASGGVWSGDSYASTRNASMTALVGYINGQRGTVSAVTARTFTASKDTYVDVLNTAGVFSLVYTEVTNNAASPALAANSMRIGIVVTGASNIAAAASINQGQEDRVLPIASSIAYSVTDSLGNLICPRDPNRKILGYRQILSNFTTASTSPVQITGLSLPLNNIPAGRKIRITAHGTLYNTTGAASAFLSIWDGVVNSGTMLERQDFAAAGVNYTGSTTAITMLTPTSTSKTYNIGLQAGSGTAGMQATSAIPAFIMVELV